MLNNLYVKSLAWATDDESLKAYFQTIGTVVTASVIRDRETGRSRGFGFVEMSTPEEATKAVETLDNTDLDGRTIGVAIAQPREERPQRDFNN